MKILIADDDPVTRETLAATLEREGFETITAEHGEAAFAAWKAERPDLICLDIMMPQKDGFTVCREIRGLDANVPILFLSAKNEEIDVVVGLELGADDFIRKPFGKRELIARIRKALARRDRLVSSEPDQFDFGKWTIFPRKLTAVAGAHEIDLSPREIGLLTMMRRRVGEVVTRDELLSACWGADYLPESRTLDQHISKLRRKIETNSEHPAAIETIRGIGYRYTGN
ncbi:MAG: response regulator transcription factor [Verrucomicrobiota bacterium]